MYLVLSYKNAVRKRGSEPEGEVGTEKKKGFSSLVNRLPEFMRTVIGQLCYFVCVFDCVLKVHADAILLNKCRPR